MDIEFYSKDLVRTNLHLFEYQRNYFMQKGTNLAKLVRGLLDEEIFKDMGGKNPEERLEEAKRELEVAQTIYDEEQKHLEFMKSQIGSIQTTLERYLKAQIKGSMTPEAYNKITKEYGIKWETFKLCADNYHQTGFISWEMLMVKNIKTEELV